MDIQQVVQQVISGEAPVSEAETELVCEVMKQVAPLQAGLVGISKLEAVARKEPFASIDGGRNLSLFEALGHLSSIATLTQCVILAKSHYVAKSAKSASDSSTASAVEVAQAVNSAVERYPVLLDSSQLDSERHAELIRVALRDML